MNPAHTPTSAARASGLAGAAADLPSWQRTAQGISLVRHAPPPRPMLVRAEPEAVTLDLARTALVVIDMQNDFCERQGWFGAKGIDVRPMRKPIPVLKKVLPAWRAAGAQTVWLNWGIRPDLANLSPTIRFKGKRSAEDIGYGEPLPTRDSRALVQGDWGAAVIDALAVHESDLLVHKHRLSGFWDNELDSLLRQRGITTLVFAGINTDRCVFATLQDAAFLGYDCLLLADACGTPSPAYVTRAIHFLVQQLHGFVIGSDALLPALADAAAPAAASSLKESA